MKKPDRIPTPEISRALAVKRNNALTAALCGGALAVTAVRLYGLGPLDLALPLLMIGLVAGLLYANGFEYALHRWVLHWGDGFLVQRHALHHNSMGTRDEPRYVNFATNPWVVVLVFVVNSAPVFAAMSALDRWLPNAFVPGILGAGVFGGFTAYFVAYEEVHWRIHMGGWLPSWLAFARRHHMQHHADVEGRYNVFIPVFDWIFARFEGKGRAVDQT